MYYLHLCAIESATNKSCFATPQYALLSPQPSLWGVEV